MRSFQNTVQKQPIASDHRPPCCVYNFLVSEEVIGILYKDPGKSFIEN